MKFETGLKETVIDTIENGKAYFRYIAPVYVEASCLNCHSKEGYKIGDVRGAISIKFNIDYVERTLRTNRLIIIILGIISVLILLGIIYFFIIKLINKVNTFHQVIAEMAITDELTQLFNRRYFFNKLKQEYTRAKRYKHNLSCLMIDVDFFKKINDNYGHATGDTILQKVADLIKDNCRQTDIVARYGGEEIVVLLPETGQEGVVSVAENIRKATEQQDFFDEKGLRIQITVSIGAVSLNPDRLNSTANENELVKYADDALYRAKSKGRNRLEVYEAR